MKIRRDVLKRLVAQGRMEARVSYHYDEMIGLKTDGEWLPARMREGGLDDWKPGYFNMTDFDFASRTGYASRQNGGTIILAVHSNLSYELREDDNDDYEKYISGWRRNVGKG